MRFACFIHSKSVSPFPKNMEFRRNPFFFQCTVIFNEKGDLINEGEVVLGFMDGSTGKPRRAPEEFIQILLDAGLHL